MFDRMPAPLLGITPDLTLSSRNRDGTLSNLVEPHQRLIHKALSGSNLRRSDLGVRTVPTLRYRFDGREILVVAIAIAKEKERLESSSFA